MSTKNEAQSADPSKQATSNGMAAALNDEITESLASFFDVLIQMDLEAKQDNEQRIDEDAQKD